MFINVSRHFLWSCHEGQILVTTVTKSSFHLFGYLKVGLLLVSATLLGHNQSYSGFCQLLKFQGQMQDVQSTKKNTSNIIYSLTVPQLAINFKTSAKIFTNPYKVNTIILINNVDSWKFTLFFFNSHRYQSSILLILKDSLLISEQWLLALIIPWNQNRFFSGSSCVTLSNIYTL